jgi:hypothetical protein
MHTSDYSLQKTLTHFLIAVMVGNETLFILFGKDSTLKGISSVAILNVTDPNHITYIDKYIDPKKNQHTPPNTSLEEWNGLSTGAIAGIAVGCVIAVKFSFFLKKKLT